MISGEKRDGADQNGSTELGMGWYGSIFGSCDMHARMIKLVGEHRQSVDESVFRMSAMATGRYQHETPPFSSGWKGPPLVVVAEVVQRPCGLPFLWQLHSPRLTVRRQRGHCDDLDHGREGNPMHFHSGQVQSFWLQPLLLSFPGY